MKKTHAEHNAAYRSKRREEGWESVTLWLDPLTAGCVRRLCAYQGKSKAQLLQEILTRVDNNYRGMFEAGSQEWLDYQNAVPNLERQRARGRPRKTVPTR